MHIITLIKLLFNYMIYLLVSLVGPVRYSTFEDTSVFSSNKVPTPSNKDNSRMVKKTEDLLLFSKKPRAIAYQPNQAPLGNNIAMELGKLGPDLDNEELLYKKAVAYRVLI